MGAVLGALMIGEADADSLDGMGFIYAPAPFSGAYGISGNGGVVVGFSTGNGSYEAVISVNGALTPLGFLPNALSNTSYASAANTNGSVVVGWGYNEIGQFEAFRWADGQMTGLGTLPGGEGGSSEATGVSGDGSIVVGWSSDGAHGQAFRWVDDGSGGTMINLGNLNDFYGLGANTAANGISADGKVIVGYSYNGYSYQAFRWTEDTLMTGLGALPNDGYNYSYALAVNSDGSVIVGYLRNGYTNQAFRWVDDENGGTMSGLGFLSGDTDSIASAVSADGSIVVGYSGVGSVNSGGVGGPFQAFRWIAGDPAGMVSITDLLTEAGVSLGTWQLLNATGISASGNTIVGYGLDPDGYQEGWIARFGIEPGLISEDAALNSLATLGKVPAAASAFLSDFIDTDSEYARNTSTEPEEQPLGYADDGVKLPEPDRSSRLRVFGYGVGGLGSDLQGGSGTALVGASLEVANNFVIGASGGYGSVRGDMSEKGKADIEGPAGTLFAAYTPWSGFQFLAAGAVAGFDANITRGYMNGEGTAFSSGSTTGDGYGGVLRIGYAAPLSDHMRIEPFASFKATHVSLDGYTEHDGPFPAEIAALSQTDEESRVGVETRLLLSRESWVWGSAAWGHRYEGLETTVSAQLIDLFGVSGSISSAQTDWAELAIGTSIAMTEATRLTVSLTGDCFDDGSVSGTGRLGFSVGL